MLVETIFNYPGMGRLLLEAVANRDFPLMQALFLFITVGVLVANFLADMFYGFLDPRVRRGKQHDYPDHTPSDIPDRDIEGRRGRLPRGRRVAAGCPAGSSSCGATASAASGS